MFKENIKQFFGHSWKSVIKKIIFGLILLLVVAFIHAYTWSVADYWSFGWPFDFYESWGPTLPGGLSYRINNLSLLADMVLWYLVLCLITYLFIKIRGKKDFTDKA